MSENRKSQETEEVGRGGDARCPAVGPRGVRCAATSGHRGSHFAVQLEWDDPPRRDFDLDAVDDREAQRRGELSPDHRHLAEALGLEDDAASEDSIARRALVVIEGLRSRVGRRR